MSNLAPLKFSHQFGTGLIVTLTLIRAENTCPKIESTKKGFITPEIEAEYQDWCLECSKTALTNNTLTEGELEAIAVRHLEKELSFQRAFDPTKLGYKQQKQEAEDACRYQVDALIDAGWTMVIPNSIQTETWQYYWRRPSRCPGKPGRKFLSTNQAYMAMMKEAH